MGRAELNYLIPLLDLGLELMGEDEDDATFGLGTVSAGSSLWDDDQTMKGYWVSGVVSHAVSAALDHIVTLRAIVVKAEMVTNNAPWTLLRGVLEPAATALWVLSGTSRQARQGRALRVWYHDMLERGMWEVDTGWKPPRPTARGGRARAAGLLDLARDLGVKPTAVSAGLNSTDVIKHCARLIGEDPNLASARWRESSAFAHGRSWPILSLSSVENAERIEGGFAGAFTLNEAHHREVAVLTYKIFSRAIEEYGRQSNTSEA